MYSVGKIFAVLRKISNCPEDMHQFFRNNLLTFSETFQPLCKKDTKGVDESHDVHLPSSHTQLSSRQIGNSFDDLAR